MHTKGLFNANQFDLGKVAQASTTSYSLFMLTWWFIFSPKKVKNGAICIGFLWGRNKWIVIFFSLSLFAQHTKLASEACGPLGVAGCQYICRDTKSNAARRLWHCQVCRGCCREASRPCACCLLITFWVIKYCFNQLPFHLRFWKFLRWQELTRTTVGFELR